MHLENLGLLQSLDRVIYIFRTAAVFESKSHQRDKEIPENVARWMSGKTYVDGVNIGAM